MISDAGILDNNELDIGMNLRNKLARAQYEVGKLNEEKLKLASKLTDLQILLDSTETIINELRTTIQNLSASPE